MNDDYELGNEFKDQLIPLALEYYLEVIEHEDDGEGEDDCDGCDEDHHGHGHGHDDKDSDEEDPKPAKKKAIKKDAKKEGGK